MCISEEILFIRLLLKFIIGLESFGNFCVIHIIKIHKILKKLHALETWCSHQACTLET